MNFCRNKDKKKRFYWAHAEGTNYEKLRQKRRISHIVCHPKFGVAEDDPHRFHNDICVVKVRKLSHIVRKTQLLKYVKPSLWVLWELNVLSSLIFVYTGAETFKLKRNKIELAKRNRHNLRNGYKFAVFGWGVNKVSLNCIISAVEWLRIRQGVLYYFD